MGAKPALPTKVTLNGRDLNWLMEIGQYTAEKQLEIQQLLEKIEAQPFLKHRLEYVTNYIDMLEEIESHLAYLMANYETEGDPGDHSAKLCNRRAYILTKLNKLLDELGQAFQPAELVVDARVLQRFLQLEMQ